MIKILFVCLGNICRSPMAEFILKDLVRRRGIADEFTIASCATSDEELGNPVYPPARRMLAGHGIDCSGKRARQMVRGDYEQFDLLFGMENRNVRRMRAICGGDPEGKIARLLDGTARPRDIADPWYTGDFQQAWDDIYEGCQALLERLGYGGEQ